MTTSKLNGIIFICIGLMIGFPEYLHAQKQQDPYRYGLPADSIKNAKNDKLFDSLNLGKLGLGRRAFDYAMLGHEVLKSKKLLSNEDLLSIADMSAASGKKRFFVLDVKNYRLLFVTYVAHGRNSGLDQTLYFSNEAESYKSSVGFYITSNTYSGKHGFSMRLEGIEMGFNNNAMSRDIVMHSADYVSAAVVKSQGYIGRSLGCPALSPEVYKPIIEKIKNGSCLFIYGNDSRYIINSRLLKRPVVQGKRKI
ncbi:MAG: murein L,D-transpeptidase catalytic domain family protein [Ferruginibacter sp.]